MPVHGIDHLELFVGNAAQAAYYYRRAFGFTETAYRGLETGTRDRVSHVLEQGRIRLVLTGTLTGADEIADHHHAPRRRRALDRAQRARRGGGLRVRRGPWRAWACGPPMRSQTSTAPWCSRPCRPTARRAISSCSAATTPARFSRASRRAHNGATGRDGLLVGIDHVVGNVELGHMQEWVGYYERVFGMTELIHFSDQAISTKYSALMSKVVTDGSGRIKFPINEPAQGKRKSQIEEYLDFYRGPGVQHIAVSTTDIVATVDELCRRGVEFLPIPASYYTEVPERIGEIDQDIADLRRLGILVDRDDEGYLLQIFTHAVGDRPTVFFELIERHGARGFGEGNFKALFEALEREQERRGNL